MYEHDNIKQGIWTKINGHLIGLVDSVGYDA